MVWLGRAGLAGLGALATALLLTASLQPTPAAATWNAAPGAGSWPDIATSYQFNATHSGGTSASPMTTPLQALWTANLGGPVSYAVMGPYNIYVTATDPTTTHPKLYALNYVTGAINWGPVDLGGRYWANALYDNGLVITVNFTGQMQAFDDQTGALVWTTQLPNQSSFTTPPVGGIPGFTGAGDLVFTSGAGSGGTLYAIHASTGAIAWQAAVMNGDHSAPVVTNSGVYVSYACAQTYDFEPQTGALLWHHSTGCEGGGGKTAALYNGKLYVRDAAVGNVVLDANNGAVVSTFSATTAPAFSGTTGFFLNGSALQAVNLNTGANIWSFSGDGTLSTAPIVVGANVFIGATSGNLYALDASTGAQTWSTQLSSGISSSDEQNASSPLTGLNEGAGYLMVPAGNTMTAFVSAFSVAPGGVNFGLKLLGSSTSVSIGVTDQFAGPVTISSATTTGDYGVTGIGCGAAGSYSLGNGGQCSLTVTFTPTAYGQRNGTLTINDNAPGSPHMVTLTGGATDGRADHLVLYPAALSLPVATKQAYEAEASDAYGNDLGDVTTSTSFWVQSGTCTQNICSATTAGSQPVSGIYSTTNSTNGSYASGVTTLTVTPGPLDHITISPASGVSIVAGSGQAYTTEGYDQYNNDLGSTASATTYTIAPDGSCSGASCTATIAGSHTVTATDNGKTATGSLTVNAGPLASLTLTPASTTITAGGSVTYAATGADQYGNNVGDVTAGTALSIAPPDGTCNQATHICTATVAVSHTVTGAAGNATATATLNVTGAGLDHITIAPTSASISAGGSQSYTTEAFDQYGNDLGSATSASSFTIAPDGSCTGATCTASVAGSHTVTASDAAKTASASLSVTPGAPSALTITPASASVSAGGTVTFTATATDGAGNSLGDVTLSTTFAISPDGSCSGRFCGSTKAGAHTVTATYQGTTATASMTVTPAPVTNLALSPASATIVAGGGQAYTAVAYDQYGNSFGDVTASTTFYVDSILNPPCAGNTCSSTAAGAHHVVGEWNTAGGSSALTVTAGPLDHITLAPASAAITAGGNQSYVVEGYDQYNNDLGNQTSVSTLAIAPDGTCSGISCGATKTGAHTVTATVSGKTATASLTVNAGALDHVALTPASAAIAAGGSQTYAVEGYDAYGNDLGSFTANSSLAITPDGNCANAACSATKAGAHTVTATSQGKSATASLTVNAGPIAVVAVTPASVSLTVKQSQAFTATASDAYGNPLSASGATWSLSAGTPGTISPTSGTTSTFTASDANTGTGSLKATIGGMSRSVAITVVPAAPANLTASVKPTKVTLSWQSAAGAKTYAIYRGTSSTSLVLLKSGLTGNNFTDAPGSGTFYYYVVAIGSTGLQSAPSNTVSATFK